MNRVTSQKLIQVVIGGVESSEDVIMLKVVSFLNSFQYSNLLRFLREKKFKYIRSWNVWHKHSKNLEEEMNELENLLIDLDIGFINKHPRFESVYSDIYS